MYKLTRLLPAFLTMALVILSLSSLPNTSATALGALSGRIIDLQTGLAANREVIVKNFYFERTVHTDSQGMFRISQLPIGSYRVSLRRNGADAPIIQDVSVHLGREAQVTLYKGSSNSVDPMPISPITPHFTLDDQGLIRTQKTWIDDKVYYAEYAYTQDGKIKTISDSLNQVWEYEYSQTGKINKIIRRNRGVIIFHYDETDNLSYIYLPWGFKIHYGKNNNIYTKTVTKYKNRKIVELAYDIDERGRKTKLREGLGNPQVFGYSYDRSGRLIKIRDLNTLEENSSVSTRFGRISDSRRTGEIMSVAGNSEDRHYEYQFDSRGNIVFQKDKKNPIDVARQFNDMGLVVREFYSYEGRPSLDIIYRYDSFGRLAYKSQSNGIVYYYLRDKDGHLMHKLIRNINTGVEEDGTVFGPYLSEVDPEGFELIRYKNREELSVRDLEGNKRYVIDIFDVLRHKLAYQQRNVLTDGDFFPENEIIMQAILEKNKPVVNSEYLSFICKLFDISLVDSGSQDEVSIQSQEAGPCCYRDGYCTAACSACFGDCDEGGGDPGDPGDGGGPGGGGSGGGGGSNCSPYIAGPSMLYENQVGVYVLEASGCSGASNFVWSGGLGPNTGTSLYQTSWLVSGMNTVSVLFQYSETILTTTYEIDPETGLEIPVHSWEVVVTARSAHTTVFVEEEPGDGDGGDGGGGGGTTVPNIEILSVISPSPGHSFISTRSRSGDQVMLTARALLNGQDISGQLSWSLSGSSSATISPTTGPNVSFVPQPGEAPTGRAGALSYTITAGIPNSSAQPDSVNLVQDTLDRLRQEYEDLEGRISQSRFAFDTNPPAFPGLLGIRAHQEIYNPYHILNPVNTYATDTNIYYIIVAMHWEDIIFTGGYRTPVGNNEEEGSSPTSAHQYGRAFDFDCLSSQNNYDAYLCACNAGASQAYLHGTNGINYGLNGQDVPPPSQVNYDWGHAGWSQ